MATRVRAILEAVDLATPTLKRIDAGLVRLGTVSAALGAGTAITAFGYALARGLQASIEAAAEAEEVQARLAQAIKQSGQSVEDTLPAVSDMASALQDWSGESDEAIKSGQALLIALGKLRGEGLERASKAALDFAAGTGRDLNQAFLLIARAAAGNVREFSRLGVEFSKTDTPAQKLAKVLGFIEGTLGGQAQAKVSTFTGQIKALGNTLNDTAEIVGGPFTEVFRTFLADALNPMARELKNNKEIAGAYRLAILDAGIAVATLGEVLEPATKKIVGVAIALGFVRVTEFTSAINALTSVYKIAGVEADKTGFFAKVLADLEALKASAPGVVATFGAVGDAVDDIDTDKLDLSLFRTPSDVVPEALDRWAAAATRASVAMAQLAADSDQVTDFANDVEASQWETLLGIVEQIGEADVANRIREAEAAARDLGNQLERSLIDVGTQGALELGDALIDAASGAQVSWSRFFADFFRQVARAITQTLILHAIAGIGNAAASSGGGAALTGATVPVNSILPGGAIPTGGGAPVSVTVNAPLTVSGGVNGMTQADLAVVLRNHTETVARVVADRVRRGGSYAEAFR